MFCCKDEWFCRIQQSRFLFTGSTQSCTRSHCQRPCNTKGVRGLFVAPGNRTRQSRDVTAEKRWSFISISARGIEVLSQGRDGVSFYHRSFERGLMRKRGSRLTDRQTDRRIGMKARGIREEVGDPPHFLLPPSIFC